MELTMKVGQVTLTMRAPDDLPDLTRYDVQPRITTVMQREAQRFSEIIAAAVKDAEADRRDAARRRSIKPEDIGPTQIVGAGTKDPKSRITVDREGNQVPNADAVAKLAKPAKAVRARKARRS
jgi:hypothetical protein